MKLTILAVMALLLPAWTRSRAAEFGPDLSQARMSHYATTLADGTVEVVGGHGGGSPRWPRWIGSTWRRGRWSPRP